MPNLSTAKIDRSLRLSHSAKGSTCPLWKYALNESAHNTISGDETLGRCHYYSHRRQSIQNLHQRIKEQRDKHIVDNSKHVKVNAANEVYWFKQTAEKVISWQLLVELKQSEIIDLMEFNLEWMSYDNQLADVHSKSIFFITLALDSLLTADQIANIRMLIRHLAKFNTQTASFLIETIALHVGQNDLLDGGLIEKFE